MVTALIRTVILYLILIVGLRRDWDARQTWLHIVIEHGEINEAESLLRRCLVLCTAQERTDLRADLAALRSQMVLLNEMERVSVKNIL